MILLIVSFILLIIIGVPIAYCMGLSSLAYFVVENATSIPTIVQRNLSSVQSLNLLAVPFFVLSGELMEKGGISERLVNFASAMVGHFRGGIAQVCILTTMIFSSISGSGIAGASAVGGLVFPSMKKQKYDMGWGASLQASAATLGPIIPPSLNMILYGSLCNVSIGMLFMGALIPGIIMGIGLMVVVAIESRLPQFGFLARGSKVTAKERWIAFKDAILALIAPIIMIGGILSGVFTATEAGVVAAVYSFIVGAFVYRKINLKNIQEIFTNSIRTSGTVMIIVGFGGAFGWILSWVKFPTIVQNALTSVSSNPYIILTIIVLFLLVLTMFVEGLTAVTIFAPVFYAITNAFHFNPVYFGVVVMLAILIGAATPPVGVLLYVSSSIAGCSFSSTVKHVWPFIGVLGLVIVLCLIFPPLITAIPNLLS